MEKPQAESDKERGDLEGSSYPPSPEKRVEGRGTWPISAFHLATTIATPAAFAPLPYAMSQLGWPGGTFTCHPSLHVLLIVLKDSQACTGNC